MKEIIDYILLFLLGDESSNLASTVGYTSNPDEYASYKLVIKPSGFFDENIYGTAASLPVLPLTIWEETPLLFGEPIKEQVGNTLVLHADLVASTYFLISRYEEIVRKDCRDVHGRFIGKESLPYRAGFIDRPLVEEYGVVLRNQLASLGCDVPQQVKKIRKIYLTHDVDQLAHYRNLRGMLGGLLRGLRWPKEGNDAFKSFFGGLKFDPWYTIPWLFAKNNSAKKIIGKNRCETIVFIRGGGGLRKEDKPVMLYLHPDFKNLIKLCKAEKIKIGLHASYEAGISPDRILSEKKNLQNHIKTKISYNRHHYLSSREPEDMQALIDANISDDFTMSYADVAGFRLGTCKSVKWINPISKTLTALTLHPLTIMDSTLSDKRYMYMNAFDAYQYCIQLVDAVESYNGELVLLWHNTSVEKKMVSYHRKLYEDLIEYIKIK
jgi:hypothetical protein